MNKKGFTTIELILTIVLVAIIMATITNVTFTYRDRSVYEQTKTEVTNYKNTLTKIIYDDILDSRDPVTKIQRISDLEYNLLTNKGNSLLIKINKDDDFITSITYNGVNYNVPFAEDELVEFEGVVYKEDLDSNLYSLEIVFTHLSLENPSKIRIVVS